MGFMNSYKRLEKLCGEVIGDDRRVAAYIEEMCKLYRGAYTVSGWNEDLRRLKHYKWVRNQIAHDPACNEENMCDDEDAQWLDDFYNRIMSQTDPLALYRKATQAQQREQKKKATDVHYRKSEEPEGNKQEIKRNPSGCGAALLVSLAIFIVGMTIAWLLMR